MAVLIQACQNGQVVVFDSGIRQVVILIAQLGKHGEGAVNRALKPCDQQPGAVVYIFHSGTVFNVAVVGRFFSYVPQIVGGRTIFREIVFLGCRSFIDIVDAEAGIELHLFVVDEIVADVWTKLQTGSDFLDVIIVGFPEYAAE